MGDFHDSRYANQLKYIRICLAVLCLLIFLEICLFTPVFYITLQGLTGFFTLIFFLGAALSYFIDCFNKNNAMCALFLICWALSWSNVLISHQFSFDDLTWTFAIIITIDYIYNRIPFIRAQYIFPLIIFALYFSILYGQKIWLFGILTEHILEYLRDLLISWVIALIFLEIGRFIKVKSCRESENEQSLL